MIRFVRRRDHKSPQKQALCTDGRLARDEGLRQDLRIPPSPFFMALMSCK